ncbi:MAG: EAL domain-containing protein [Sphingomicrobium sp.]
MKIAPADLGMLDGFERALINNRLHLAYQPKVSLVDGSLKRVEALVRWDDPMLGPVPPSRFVPLAERNGLIDPLTHWGLRTALSQWRVWHKQGIDICLAFNISALSLEQLDFPDLVERMCRALEVPTERLVLELTEGATQPLIKLMDTLTRFRIKGIGLAIDDFGTGYSTLMQLRQLPFTELKIDRFFLTDMMESADSRLIVKTMIDLAHGLGLTATAEGVETEAQLRLLRELGCDVAQGYLIATPLAPETLGEWYRDWCQRWPALIDEAPPLAAKRTRPRRKATSSTRRASSV